MDNSNVAVLMALSGVIGGIVTKGLDWWTTKTDKQTAHEVQVRKDTLIEYKDLLDRQGDRIAVLEKKSENCEERENKLERTNAKLRGRVEVLESALEHANIPFRKWVDPDDTGPHTPLPKDEINP